MTATVRWTDHRGGKWAIGSQGADQQLGQACELVGVTTRSTPFPSTGTSRPQEQLHNRGHLFYIERGCNSRTEI
jgi:hypothetical protein